MTDVQEKVIQSMKKGYVAHPINGTIYSSGQIRERVDNKVKKDEACQDICTHTRPQNKRAEHIDKGAKASGLGPCGGGQKSAPADEHGDEKAQAAPPPQGLSLIVRELNVP